MTFKEAVRLMARDFKRWGKRKTDKVWHGTHKWGVQFTEYVSKGKG